VLIEKEVDHVAMGYVVIAFILLVGPLAALIGADSRIDEVRRLDWRRSS
jgi:hypothetical protein